MRSSVSSSPNMQTIPYEPTTLNLSEEPLCLHLKSSLRAFHIHRLTLAFPLTKEKVHEVLLQIAFLRTAVTYNGLSLRS
jgi:hypothetical protein